MCIVFVSSTNNPPPQDLENQALAEAEIWREQQVHLQEQQALQTRAKQDMEAEVERYKQVQRNIAVLVIRCIWVYLLHMCLESCSFYF